MSKNVKMLVICVFTNAQGSGTLSCLFVAEHSLKTGKMNMTDLSCMMPILFLVCPQLPIQLDKCQLCVNWEFCVFLKVSSQCLTSEQHFRDGEPAL